MVKTQLTYNTASLDISHLITIGASRNSRDISTHERVIEVSIIANISTKTCESFPDYITVGGTSDISTCDYSQLQPNIDPTDKIQTNFDPELEFNFKYAFILTAHTREEVMPLNPILIRFYFPFQFFLLARVLFNYIYF